MKALPQHSIQSVQQMKRSTEDARWWMAGSFSGAFAQERLRDRLPTKLDAIVRGYGIFEFTYTPSIIELERTQNILLSK
ncbi:hypothetical protein N7520_002429 [Penicillium odoratum]|uniref:uncharacterized protein n=1 Tax=Penicillium odoratum TaxID=1167516 RepID=UPI002546927E|nr:uncharacterized protein N7520_002429 [Penicillium odoratum]KAJ5771900.1 hypothetical protein N7520_002429 [Penicillium odoratum]